MRKPVAITVYMTQLQALRLQVLSRATRVPLSVYIRDGIDKVLERELPQYTAQLEFQFGEMQS